MAELAATEPEKNWRPLKDPVCGMTVTEQSEHQIELGDEHYYFCSAGCKSKFSADPGQYTSGKPVTVQKMSALATSRHTVAPESANKGTIYTCPMHLEIRQSHPGNCPICGMTLEPLIPELEEGENKELIDFNAAFGGRCH